jgi:hypothetical protein
MRIGGIESGTELANTLNERKNPERVASQAFAK